MGSVLALAAGTGCQATSEIQASSEIGASILALREATAVVSAIAGDLLHLETTQTAGGDINDPWIGRGAMAAGSIIFYMAVVRPFRSLVIRRIRK